MKEILNINQEINQMDQCVEKVQYCANTLLTVHSECLARMQRVKLNMLLTVVTIYTIGAIGLRLIGNQVLDTYYYLGAAVVSALIVFLVTRSFPTNDMTNIGTLCMVIVALASVTPVVPDLFYNSFTSVSQTSVAVIRILSMPFLVLAWIMTLAGDRGRNRRLKKIWDNLED